MANVRTADFAVFASTGNAFMPSFVALFAIEPVAIGTIRWEYLVAFSMTSRTKDLSNHIRGATTLAAVHFGCLLVLLELS